MNKHQKKKEKYEFGISEEVRNSPEFQKEIDKFIETTTSVQYYHK